MFSIALAFVSEYHVLKASTLLILTILSQSFLCASLHRLSCWVILL